MKKLLLLGAILAGSILSANAQTTCANAVNITGTGTFTVGNITGTLPTGAATATCYTGTTTNAGTAMKAMWYKFVATQSGIMTVDAAIAANPVASTDTRLRILRGTCGALTCITANDDATGSDYRSKVSDLVVTAGNTYYIVWDSYWQASGFSFNFTFTAQSCFLPTQFTYVGAPTTTSVTIGWTAPTTGTTAAGYQVEYGPQGFALGSGTVVNVTTNQVQMSNLNPSSVYDFYIKTDCGSGTFSNQGGPITFTTVFESVNAPYNTSFDTQSNFDFIGWFEDTDDTVSEPWSVNVATAGNSTVQNGTNSAFSFASANAVSDSWLISRGVNLVAGSPVTITYWLRNYLGTGSTGTGAMELTVGTTQDAAGQTTIIDAEDNIANTTFGQRTKTFTPQTSGVYYFGFHNISSPNAGTQALLLDNVTIDQALSVGDVFARELKVSPNPATNVVNISNVNGLVNGVEITDMNGRTVKTVKLAGVTEAQINVSDLSAGMYLMNISSDKGAVTKKIVKQ